jgi:hypothetical protein
MSWAGLCLPRASSSPQLLEQIVEMRLGRGLTTVVDTTGLDSGRRSTYLELALQFDVPAVAVRFSTTDGLQNFVSGCSSHASTSRREVSPWGQRWHESLGKPKRLGSTTYESGAIGEEHDRELMAVVLERFDDIPSICVAFDVEPLVRHLRARQVVLHVM